MPKQPSAQDPEHRCIFSEFVHGGWATFPEQVPSKLIITEKHVNTFKKCQHFTKPLNAHRFLTRPAKYHSKCKDDSSNDEFDDLAATKKCDAELIRWYDHLNLNAVGNMVVAGGSGIDITHLCKRYMNLTNCGILYLDYEMQMKHKNPGRPVAKCPVLPLF